MAKRPFRLFTVLLLPALLFGCGKDDDSDTGGSAGSATSGVDESGGGSQSGTSGCAADTGGSSGGMYDCPELLTCIETNCGDEYDACYGASGPCTAYGECTADCCDPDTCTCDQMCTMACDNTECSTCGQTLGLCVAMACADVLMMCG